MNPSNPYWYEELKDNPLSRKTFTDELALRIKDKAFASTAAQNQSRTVLRPLVIVGAGLLCLLGLILFLSDKEWSSKGWNSESYTAGLPEPPVGLPESPIEAIPVLSEGEMNQILSKKAPTDSEWEQLINNSLPHEDEEVMSGSKEMLYKKSVGDDVMLVFSKMQKQSSRVTLGIDYYEWDSQKWNRQQRASYAIDEDLSKTEKGLITSWYELDTTPIFYGVIIDPGISQIRITNEEQHIQEMAEIIVDEVGYSYWIAALPPQNDTYNVETIDAEGSIISTSTYSY